MKIDYLPRDITKPRFGINAAIITRKFEMRFLKLIDRLTSDENKSNTEYMFRFIYYIFIIFIKNFTAKTRPKK
jgi:hypothetical protein